MNPPIVIFDIIFPLPLTAEECRETISLVVRNRRCEEEDFYRNNEHAFRFVVSSSNVAGNFFIENKDDPEYLFRENGVCRGIRIRSFLPKGRNGRCVGPFAREEWNKNAIRLSFEIRGAFNTMKQWNPVK